MRSHKLRQRILGGLTLALKIYLITFLMGCTPRPTELPVEQARQLSTKVIQGAPGEVAKAVVTVLQDLHFSLDVVNTDLGLINASKKTQRPQGTISREEPPVTTEEGLSDAETFCLVVGIFAAVALILSAIFDGPFFDDDDDDEDYDHDHDQGCFWGGHRTVVHEHSYWGGPDYPTGASYYEYKITVNLMDTGYGQTELRLSIQGSYFDDGILQKTGPVQDPELYDHFFGQVGTLLNRPFQQP